VRQAQANDPNPLRHTLDRATKWLGKGKAVEHAQQMLNAGADQGVAAKADSGKRIAAKTPASHTATGPVKKPAN
jgi:hypothetical protein